MVVVAVVTVGWPFDVSQSNMLNLVLQNAGPVPKAVRRQPEWNLVERYMYALI